MAPPATSYYPAAPLPPAIYDWTGLYIGGNVGAGLLADTVNPIGTGTEGTLLSPASHDTVGIIGGGQAGVNFEWAPWVIGAEVSWDASNISGPATAVASVPGTAEQTTSNPQWMATATGRFGWASNDLLFYAKGGGAWMHVSYTQDILATTQSIGDNRTGFTAGAGLEYGMTENLSAKIEYDFLDFGTKDYPVFTATPISVKSNLHMLTAGINYRFSWAGGGPLHP